MSKRVKFLNGPAAGEIYEIRDDLNSWTIQIRDPEMGALHVVYDFAPPEWMKYFGAEVKAGVDLVAFTGESPRVFNMRRILTREVIIECGEADILEMQKNDLVRFVHNEDDGAKKDWRPYGWYCQAIDIDAYMLNGGDLARPDLLPLNGHRYVETNTKGVFMAPDKEE